MSGTMDATPPGAFAGRPGPETAARQRDRVQELIEQADYVNAYAVSIPDRPDLPIPPPEGGSSLRNGTIERAGPSPRSIGRAGPSPQSIERAGPSPRFVGVRIFEHSHRFAVTVHPPRAGKGLGAGNVVDKAHAFLTLRWMLTPEDHWSLPDEAPPPTLFSMARSQRFTMLDAIFVFDERNKNRFHGFGTGRTFPAVENGAVRLRIAANGNVTQGYGIFAGVEGCYVLNGYVQPPHGLYLQIAFRFPGNRFATEGSLMPLAPLPDPTPDSTFMTLLGEADPERPMQHHLAPDGAMAGATVHELLRSVRLDFDKGRLDSGLRTKSSRGPIVGRLKTDMLFNPFDPAAPGTALSPAPWQSRDTSMTFYDLAGNETGSLAADVVEGRAFRAELPGIAEPVFRLAGFGPVRAGSGQFAGASGLLSVNGALSARPPAHSNLYVLRLVDPGGTLRAAAS